MKNGKEPGQRNGNRDHTGVIQGLGFPKVRRAVLA